ncbi:MAG: hypothetical protein KKE61_14620, partial [Proteobacteria bacterium]|nr:hypothetical protein [Pseudomonadota bacterium]
IGHYIADEYAINQEKITDFADGSNIYSHGLYIDHEVDFVKTILINDNNCLVSFNSGIRNTL